MNVTVVATESGEVVASMQAHASDCAATTSADGVTAFPTLIPNPGQAIYELVVPDDFGTLEPADLHTRLCEHVIELKRNC